MSQESAKTANPEQNGEQFKSRLFRETPCTIPFQDTKSSDSFLNSYVPMCQCDSIVSSTSFIAADKLLREGIKSKLFFADAIRSTCLFLAHIRQCYRDVEVIGPITTHTSLCEHFETRLCKLSTRRGARRSSK